MSIPFSQEDNLVEEKLEQIKKSKVESIKQFLLNQSNKNQQQNDHHQNQEAQCNCRHHPHLSPGHVQPHAQGVSPFMLHPGHAPPHTVVRYQFLVQLFKKPKYSSFQSFYRFLGEIYLTLK